MRALIHFILSLLFIILLNTVRAQDSIRTEVFTLSTCDPNSNSLIRDFGNSIPKEFVRKLETRSRNASAFRITGVNPLRYKYFINNEAISQFMDASPVAISLNSFTNGEYLVTAPEIKMPEIFKTDSIGSKAKTKIQEYINNAKVLADSIERVRVKMYDAWEKELIDAKDSTRGLTNYKKNSYLPLKESIDNLSMEYDKLLNEFESYTRPLPINNPNFAIFQQYREEYSITIDSTDPAALIKKYQFDFANRLVDYQLTFKLIDELLYAMHTGKRGSFSIEDSLNSLLVKCELAMPQQLNTYAYLNTKHSVSEFIHNVRKLLLTKKFQISEEFVLNLATRIGVLVQDLFRSYSSFNNHLENLNCIDADILGRVRLRRTQLSKIFNYIQKTSAELQILVSYLDVNTELYQNIAKKINANYLFLLGYLKNLNYIVDESTKQYTLPTHSNLKNIDLVRYKVMREDKITKSTQTYNYDFWVKGGFKIDFSVGIFASQLVDNKYSKILLDTAGGVDSIRIARQDDGRADFAFGGMVNLIHRNGASWINFGASVGVAYSSNSQLQVLAGLSLHLGKTERLIIHGGFAFGRVKYLDIAANDFKFYDKDSKEVLREHIGSVKEKDRIYILHSPDVRYSSYSIPTVGRFVGRPFIGISYNLSKKSALSAVSGGGVQKFAESMNGTN